MKIPLHGMSHQLDGQPTGKISESEIFACKRGDWEAKNRMAHAFTPLLQSLARKRVPDGNPSRINDLVEAGKKGLFQACRRYSSSVGISRFQIFALDYIEASMNACGKGFLAWLHRLFSKR